MYTLNVLNRLKDIAYDKDIKSLSYAVFPGTHCPLFGVVLTASYIKNMALVIVGTNECTYYSKNFAYHRQSGQDSVYSVVLKDKDIVFGAEKKVIEAVKYISEVEKFDAIMIVTTCVPELIGEDYNALSEELEELIGIPVLAVNTEHYTCNSHIIGMTRALKSLSSVMENHTNKKGVNILGHRQENVEDTELVKLLFKEGVKINCVIPSKCTIRDIKSASSAKLNIVTDMIALDLAEDMKNKFGIEYIYFDKNMKESIIMENYNKLCNILDIDVQDELLEQRQKYNLLLNKCRLLMEGKKLIYGNTPMMAFETVDFLTELGLVPEFIQVRELYEQDGLFKDNIIKKGHNPYISRIANIAPLRSLYDTINADIYIGHENPMLLKEKGLMQITLDEHAQKIGFELPIGIMETLIKLFDVEKVTRKEVI
ncbi:MULTISPECIES: nitrogenase component 1 [unclassified Clostridioides]|uniref:nitrogenase component 1 n=1 Tax=unclassified Clostridioides TaxID=2635829 RepID=UPI001D0CB9A2|nr:oxalate:formate antiporter [Clostridioides sp. ES-S-0123-01]MCC0670766.1 oxalate:formate antiporter [Clostridioides sp. ES-S-0145-01]MCC0707052.1 oxalate:formate antiporter [Clostridioides sp. ES-S-0190-01]MCC0762157.1 oxalate:formate antiporter [Clostridioides sp. ES-S-0006-03]UDN56815.1 oxalate:formate antiporter [Clostridioides sp. ES-S-0010-02]